MLEEPLKMASSHDHHPAGPTNGGYQPAGLHSPPPVAPPSPPPEAPPSPHRYPSPAGPQRPPESSSPDYGMYGFGAGRGGYPVPVYLDKPREEVKTENGHAESAPPSPPPTVNGSSAPPAEQRGDAASPPPVEPGSPPADWPRTDSVLRFGDRPRPHPPVTSPPPPHDVSGDGEETTNDPTPRPSPPPSETDTEQQPEGDSAPDFNALQRLQHALEQNGTFSVYGEESGNGGGGVGGGGGTEIYQCHLCTYTGSSKFHFSQHMHSHYDFKCSQCDFSTHSNVSLKEHMKGEHNIEIKDYMDEPGVRVPRVNASGKVRLHKCKFCEFKTATQVEHWEHLKGHIAPEKRFWCHVCPFITDVKHHLTYHLRNHFNSKPFKCNKCEYSCVNKSMLSSHMKSHTNFYQYRCGDCNFAAKYANALKNHLRKEKHRPGMVLNPDGSPNPFVIIDVYGTRRGPKIKKDDNGMPILPSSLQENYVNFIQTQSKYITSPTNPCTNFGSPYLKQEPAVDVGAETKMALPRGYIRCDMCPYSTPDREQLTRHMMNHMTPDSQQPGETSPASSKSGEDGREPPPLPPPPAGLGRMELLRSALAQPVRMVTGHMPLTASPPPPPPPPPPAYRRPEPSEPTPRLPQYDSLAAHRVREYFSRALQSPLLYNLSMAAGLNGAPPPTAGLPLPFSMTRPPPSPPHTRVVSPRPSSPPVYERPPPHSESPQPSSPPLAGGDVALDLSRLGKRSSSDEQSPPPPAKHRRKGRAQKLELISQRLQEAGSSPQHSSGSRDRSSSPERSTTCTGMGGGGGELQPDDWRAGAHTCHNCGIAFKDLVMYTMHMGFHDYRRPFSCNKCGEQCRDAIAFFLHIARVPHNS